MRRRATGAFLGAVAAGGAVCVLAPHAVADAPKQAEIVEGRSMAGVMLGSSARLASTRDRVETGVLARWGKVRDESCLEGSNCTWDVAAGGTVDVILDSRSSRVQRMATTAQSWRTARGIGNGSTRTSLQQAYGERLLRRSTCALNRFGGSETGYVLNTRFRDERRFTFFELSASGDRIVRVWIGRGRVMPSSGC